MFYCCSLLIEQVLLNMWMGKITGCPFAFFVVDSSRKLEGFHNSKISKTGLFSDGDVATVLYAV